MAVTPAKENILKRIRQALSNPVPLPFPQSEGTLSVFHPATDSLDVVFAQEFNMTVRIQTPKLKLADARLFKQMEKRLGWQIMSAG